ncbi:MAG: SUMF1/EgtB/PvdO family nonheme iron enzyme [Lewinellaceae bacterium]|nr:SUMF1/EgtB/PvdO family nonheme iron enzyme [Lewinellaceae bacterium]
MWGGPAARFRRDPSQWRYLLAPVIARSPADQERFYVIFDEYYRDLLQRAETTGRGIPPEQQPGWQRWLQKYWWVPLTVLILGSAFLLNNILRTPIVPQVALNGPREVRIGDTAIFQAMLETVDTPQLAIRWELRDAITQEIEAADSSSGQLFWQIPPAALESGSNKVVSLEVSSPEWDVPVQQNTTLRILCQNPPILGKIILTSDQVRAFSPVNFNAPIQDFSRELRFRWDFGDGDTSALRNPSHRYRKDGTYTVSLQVSRLGVEGYCTTEIFTTLSVGEEAVMLQSRAMRFDFVTPRATFTWVVWGILILFAVGIFFFLVRWLRRPEPEIEDPDPSPKRFAAPDQPPYEIPFRPLFGLIETSSSQFRFAEVLRRRQEGLRREINVPASVEATIQQGGFPRLLQRNVTRPTEYLILVDEENALSHQGYLLKHLASTLRSQEVQIETFHFRQDLYRVWNSQYPEGLTLEHLHRLFPEHRLIIMGDGLTFLDPHAVERPQLRPDLRAELQRWPQRLLLTPRPPRDWSFREALLHQLLVVFPIDLEGQLQAAAYIEGGLEPEDLPPSFRVWRQELSKRREEPAIDRRWRTAADHREYLAERPELFRWVCALATYPSPQWDLTLAIGKALGVNLNYDNLLVISRIPWLREGRLHPRLRRELLQELSPADENLARAAVLRELEVIASQTEGGFANRQVQTHRAVQQFHLDPYDREAQEAVRQLLKQGLFSRLQLDDLNQRVAPKGPSEEELIMQQKMQMKQSSYTMEASNIPEPVTLTGNALEEFLEAEHREPERPAKPFFTPDFWGLCLSGLAFTMLLIGMWKYDSTDQLYAWTFGTTPAAYRYSPDKQLQKTFLVEERIFIDSAVIYNNQGVEIFQRQILPVLDNIRTETLPLNTLDSLTDLSTARALFNRAIASKELEDYPLALANLATLDYNLGAAAYQAWKQNPGNAAGGDTLALRAFQRASASDSLRRDAWHALGITYYYRAQSSGQVQQEAANQPTNTNPPVDSARYYYNQLLPTGYFDTLSLFPNLRTLLNQEPTTVLKINQVGGDDSRLRVNVDYYYNPLLNPNNILLTLSAIARNGRRPSAIPVATTPLQPQRNTASLQLASLDRGKIIQTDSLLAVLVDQTTGDTVARKSIFWYKNWGTQPVKPPTPNPQPVEYILTGQVLDSENRQPVSGARVIVQADPNDPNAEISFLRKSALTNSQGTYQLTFDQLVNQALDITVEAAGFEPYRTTTAPPTTGSGTRVQARLTDITLTRAAKPTPTPISTGISIQVLNCADGQPLDYAQIELEELIIKGDRTLLGNLNVDRAGKFLLSGDQVTDRLLLTINCKGFVPREISLRNLGDLMENRQLADQNISSQIVNLIGRQFRIFLLPENLLPRMQSISGGTFTMGCTQKNCHPNDLPAEKVTVGSFQMSSYEISLAQYEAFCTATGRKQPTDPGGGSRGPVGNVSWLDAVQFCNWLSALTGLNPVYTIYGNGATANPNANGYCLPTESEWEYAARGNGYPPTNSINDIAWYNKNAQGKPHPVGTKNANSFGLFDMLGNMDEWCWDVYADPVQKNNGPKVNTPIEASNLRTVRGGSWNDNVTEIGITRRKGALANQGSRTIGFRIVQHN